MIRLCRGIPLPLSLPGSRPDRGSPRLPRYRALEQSMEIITLMASLTRERTTRAPPLPSSLVRKASLEWERSRHLDGNVTLPAPPLTPRRELYRMARSHHLARRGATRANPRELSSSQWRNAILDAVTRQWCRIPPLESNYLNVLTSRRGMETLAGNDDGDDNSSLGTKGGKGVGSSRGGFVLRQPVLVAGNSEYETRSICENREFRWFARLRKVTHLVIVD